MPGYQLNVKVVTPGTAVQLASSVNVCTFIAKGATIQANLSNAGVITIGTPAVTKSTAANPVFMFQLNPGDSVGLPDNQAVDMSNMYLNADSANDGCSVGYWN